MSDRNVKTNFADVNARDVLEKVAQLPVTTWNLKSQDPSVHHMGPVAQDFRAAFGLGADEHFISSSDADGVALAAIQGLYQANKELKQENADLRARLERLEKRIGP